MSAKYAKVKEFWETGMWELRQVHDAAAKGWITAEEYKALTGQEYNSGVSGS